MLYLSSPAPCLTPAEQPSPYFLFSLLLNLSSYVTNLLCPPLLTIYPHNSTRARCVMLCHATPAPPFLLRPIAPASVPPLCIYPRIYLQSHILSPFVKPLLTLAELGCPQAPHYMVHLNLKHSLVSHSYLDDTSHCHSHFALVRRRSPVR